MPAGDWAAPARANVTEFSLVEIDVVPGGINGQEVADRVGGAILAVALAPEVALGAVAVGAAMAVGAAGGYLIGMASRANYRIGNGVASWRRLPRRTRLEEKS